MQSRRVLYMELLTAKYIINMASYPGSLSAGPGVLTPVLPRPGFCARHKPGRFLIIRAAKYHGHISHRASFRNIVPFSAVDSIVSGDVDISSITIELFSVWECGDGQGGVGGNAGTDFGLPVCFLGKTACEYIIGTFTRL